MFRTFSTTFFLNFELMYAFIPNSILECDYSKNDFKLRFFLNKLLLINKLRTYLLEKKNIPSPQINSN